MPYGIAGCIWYQGEANQGRASSYARVMQRLIGSWRTGFNKEFPFYLVQIAPFQYHSKDNGPALLREQQAMLPEMLDKVKMITVSDLVDNVQDIHPRDKRSVGKRLANLALDDTYHIYAGPYKSPVFESACRKGNHVTISFKDIKNGLTVTFRTGASSALWNGSLSVLPILNVPPGMATILNATAVPGICSV